MSRATFSQTNTFTYIGSVSFSIDGSPVAPYMCTVDSSGDVWGASTSSVSAGAIIGLSEATPGGTFFPNGSLLEALANCTDGKP